MSEPNKALGQHWLKDVASLKAVMLAADLKPDDTVLEVGPGRGSLTGLLTSQAEQVIAVELDQALAQELPSRVRAANLTVIYSDILKFDLSSLPRGYKLVANLPYYLTSHFIKFISEAANPPLRAGLLVQKEVAERLAGRPGQMGILSVTAQFYWQISLGPVIPARLFQPPPKVDSQVVSLTRRQQPLFKDVDETAYFRLVKAGFSQKRKTLLNSLRAGLKMERATVSQLLTKASIEPMRRAQSLSLEEWHRLYLALSKLTG